MEMPCFEYNTSSNSYLSRESMQFVLKTPFCSDSIWLSFSLKLKYLQTQWQKRQQWWQLCAGISTQFQISTCLPISAPPYRQSFRVFLVTEREEKFVNKFQDSWKIKKNSALITCNINMSSAVTGLQVFWVKALNNSYDRNTLYVPLHTLYVPLSWPAWSQLTVYVQCFRYK